MAEEMLVTQALAEIKTIDKRIAKKHEFMMQYLVRQEKFKDPLVSEGGSAMALHSAQQSISDLLERKIALRRAILQSNMETSLTVEGMTLSVQDWLTWKREVAPGQVARLSAIATAISGIRNEALRKGVSVGASEPKPDDVIINVGEAELAAARERLEKILGDLDGQLSIMNATTKITL